MTAPLFLLLGQMHLHPSIYSHFHATDLLKTLFKLLHLKYQTLDSVYSQNFQQIQTRFVQQNFHNFILIINYASQIYTLYINTLHM